MSQKNAYILFVKALLRGVGLRPKLFIEKIASWSINSSIYEYKIDGLVAKLREIVPDISAQESREVRQSTYLELKRRGLHAFQLRFLLDVIKNLDSTSNPGNIPAIKVVDIGDSAGTHMLYLKSLSKDINIETISVNLDPRAIKKIQAKGLTAIHCRAEQLGDRGINNIDLITSFGMIEHLHDPSKFLHQLAKKSDCKKIVISVPFVSSSRVGMHHIRNNIRCQQFAEDVHVFELCPEDWSLLFQHSGWRVVKENIYYQYPRRFVFPNILLKIFWKNYDFEGFWCAVAEKDISWSELYEDWSD